MDSPGLSIILCTHNRRDRVLRACAALARQDLPAEAFEVIVVDNASTDGTAEAVQGFARSRPGFHYLYEPQVGKVHALNAGLAVARGARLAFTDDDCEPRPDWLRRLAAELEDPQVGLVAGPAYSHFPEEVEQDPERRYLAHKFLGDFTLGGEARDLRGRESPLGCNMAARTEAARQVGGFSASFGPKGGKAGVYDDSDFAWRIARAGYRLRYQPAAAVDHYPDAARLTRQGIRSRAFATGYCAYRAKHPGPAGLGGRLGRTLLVSLEIALKGLRWLLSPSSRGRFVAEFRVRCAVGKLAGVWARG